MTIDTGTVVQDFIVDEFAYGQDDAYWLSCGHGHKVFATRKMIDGGMKIICAECRSDAAVRMKSAQIVREALEEHMFTNKETFNA